MSLDKAIEHGKEHREQYWGRRLFERSSRNHGKNSYKKELADYKNKKRKMKGESEKDEFI